MADVDTIVARVVRRLGPRDLHEVRVLVVAGATVEPIDDVRVVTNRSTGGTGIELARTAFEHGADVGMWLRSSPGAGPPLGFSKTFSGAGDPGTLGPQTGTGTSFVSYA